MWRTMMSILFVLWPFLIFGDETPNVTDTVPPTWKTFFAAGNPVHSVQWTPDERHVIATSSDGWCRVWSVETGRVVKEFLVPATFATMMPDGQHVLIASNTTKDLALYQWSTGEVIRRFVKPGDGAFWSLGVSPSGDRIAAGEGQPGSCNVWDVATGKVLCTLAGHKGRILAVSFTPDGRRLVTGGDEKERLLWNVDSGQELTRWSMPEFDIGCLDISTDGRYLAESGGSQEVVIRELATQKIVQTLRGHERAGIVKCQFLKNSPRVATSCFDKTIRVWDMTDGRELLAIRGFRHYQYGLSVSPSGTLLATGSGIDHRDGQWWKGEDFGVRLWKLPKTIWRHRTGPISVAVLGFETTGTSPGQARLRETLADDIVQTLSSRLEVHTVERNSAAFLRAERGLRAGFTSETVPLADVEAAEVLLSGTLGETSGRLDVVVRMHVVGRVEPIAQWNVAGTADKVDDLRAKVIERLLQELDLPKAIAKPSVTDKPRLAVLPFRNQTGEAKRDDWAEGLTDLMTFALGEVESISLVERQALALVLQEQQLQVAQLTDLATAIRLGKLSGADWALVGSMSGTRDKLRLSVRVVDVATTRVVAAREQTVVVAQIQEGLTELTTGLVQDLFPQIPKKLDGSRQGETVRSTRSLEYASLMARAQRLEGEKKTGEAVTAYEQTLLLQPNSFEARQKLMGCLMKLHQWAQVLEVAQSLRDRPEFQTAFPYARYEVARAEIDALTRLERTQEIRRRGPAWEQECGPFSADIAISWKSSAGVRQVETEDSKQFAAEVGKHGYQSDPLRAMYVDAFVRMHKGSVEKQMTACQDVVAVLDHILTVCIDKRDDDARRWANVIIPNAIENSTYYAKPGEPGTPILTADHKMERLERAAEVFGWLPDIHYKTLATLAQLQRFSGRYAAAAESYLKLAHLPFPEPDLLPPQLDRTERARTTFLDRRISGWSGWAQLRAKSAPESALSALETALAEVGAVHDCGPELIEAANEAGVAIRWPDHLALIWGGGHSTWQSWRNVLAPLGMRVHPVRRTGVTAADLEPYELVVLVRSGAMAFLPGEILALRSHVARGGRLLVVLSPGWDSAQPAVYQTMLDVFGYQIGEPTEVRALSTKLAEHSVTHGLNGVLAKCAVDIKAPPESRLAISGDRCLLAANEYRRGKVAIASFGQWFIPDASVYGGTWTKHFYQETRTDRLPEDMPFAEGVDAQRRLLDQLLKWMLSPVESTANPQIDAAAWRSAAAAVRSVQARVKWPSELPAVLEDLVSRAAPHSVEREEALWFAGEASQGFMYFFTSGVDAGFSGIEYALGPERDWPSQPEYYDRLINEFPNSPLLDLAQFRRADALRRRNASDHARGASQGDGPFPPIIRALEKVESEPGRPAWAWQQLRLGRLKQAAKPKSAEGLLNFQAVADRMPQSPEKGLAVQAIAMTQLELGHHAEAQRALELLLSDVPDFYYGGPDSAAFYERWKPLSDTFQNHPSRRQTTSTSLRELARQHLERMKAKN